MSKPHDHDPQDIHRCTCPSRCREPDGPIAQEHRAINRLVARADERSRRLPAALPAQQHGRGGIALLARITGPDRNTITRGRRELYQADTLPADRIRRPGGGRKRAEVVSPGS